MDKTDQQFKVAVHALIKKDNKFLVIRRSLQDDFMPGFWDTPGGCLDFGEDPTKTLIRESKEEVNLNIKIEKLLYCHNQVYLESARHWFALVYQCEIISGEIKLDPKEHQEYRWVTLEELKDLPKIDFLNDLFNNLLNKHV